MTGKGMQSSLAGARRQGYESNVVVAVGMPKATTFSAADYTLLQDLYASRFDTYDKLRERYRRKIGQDHITGKGQLPVGYDGVANKLKGTHKNRGVLTDEEKNWLKMTPAASTVQRCTINNSSFCTVDYCKDFQFDNSVIKIYYKEHPDEGWLPAFAWIKRFLIHEQYPGCLFFLQVCALRPLHRVPSYVCIYVCRWPGCSGSRRRVAGRLG